MSEAVHSSSPLSPHLDDINTQPSASDTSARTHQDEPPNCDELCLDDNSDYGSEVTEGTEKDEFADCLFVDEVETLGAGESSSRSNSPDEPAQGEDDSTQAICRICLDGSTSQEDEGESLGRLISPCKCRGTMKYVHATCLDRWRALSARTSSIVACDQCGAPYRFRKSRFVGIATSPTLLFMLSLFLFLLLIWTVGFIAAFWMDLYEDSEASVSPSERSSRTEKSTTWFSWRKETPRNSGRYTEVNVWTDMDTDMTYSGYFGYGGLVYEPAAYVRLIKEAVRQFTSGEAVEAIKDVVGLSDLDEAPVIQTDPDSERGFWSTLKHEWMYGDGGLWADHQEVTTEGAQAKESGSHPASCSESKDRTPPKTKYDARLASPFDPTARAKAKAGVHRRNTTSRSHSPAWLNKILMQCQFGHTFFRTVSLGFSLVGILSFVNLLVGASFLGPFNLHNFGLGRSFARMTNTGRRNNGSDGFNIASVLIVLLVVIGIVRALHLVYKGVRSLSRRFLSRVEEAIVDWHGEDETPATNRAHGVVG